MCLYALIRDAYCYTYYLLHMCTSRPSFATHTPCYICVLRIQLHLCTSRPSSATHTTTTHTTTSVLRILAHMCAA